MENTILFGNGLNRIANNYADWDKLLRDISSGIVLENIPNTLKYESVILAGNWAHTTFFTINGKLIMVNDSLFSMKEPIEDFIKTKIRGMHLKYNSNRFYNLMAKLDVKHYLTTNYDNTLEKELTTNLGYVVVGRNSDERLYSIRRNSSVKDPNGNLKHIWPIHGSIDVPASIMLGLDQYCGCVSKIDDFLEGKYKYSSDSTLISIKKMRERLPNIQEQEPSSWIDLFFSSNVHIIGLGLGYEEIDLWRLLTKRQRYIKEYGTKWTPNKIYYYGSLDKETDKKKLLEILGVEVVDFAITHDYEELYENILKVIGDKISNS